MSEYLQKAISILSIFKNKYALILLIFGVWMMFFDRNNVISQAKLAFELSDMREKSEYYRIMADEMRAEHEALLASDESKEKFARENYWMKKDDEDIFIVVEATK